MASPTRLVSSLIRQRSSAVSVVLLHATTRPLVRHHPLRLPFQQTRNRYFKRRDAGWDAAIREGVGPTSQIFLTQRTERELAKGGLDRMAMLALLYAVVVRARNRWNPELVYEAFHNYVKWNKDQTSVTMRWQDAKYYYLNCEVVENEGFDQAHLDILPPNKVSEALLILGRQNLLAAVANYDEEGSINSSDLTLAMFIFEIAVKYRNVEAAMLLVNISEDVAVKYWNDERRKVGQRTIMPNVSGAKSLIRESVTKDPSQCSWRTIVTYVRDEYRESAIARQTPNQLAWAIDILLLVVENLKPGRTSQAEYTYTEKVGVTPLKFSSWQQCENPWRVLHRIVSYCLKTKAGLPDYSASELLHLREECLAELIRYNDPNASFTVAVRDQKPGTAEWENLIKCAAAGGISDANWFLAASYLRQKRFLGPTEEFDFHDRERTRMAMEYAGVAAHLSLAEASIDQSRAGRETVCVNRILVHTALMKTVASYEEGEKVLQLYLMDVRDTPGIAPRMIARLQKHYDDYMQTDRMLDENWGWSEERCLDMIRNGFDMSQMHKLAQRSKNYWHHPT